MNSRYYSNYPETSRRLNLCYRKLDELASLGVLKVMRIDGHLLFDNRSLAQFESSDV